MITKKLGDEYNSVNWIGTRLGAVDAIGHASSRGIGIVQTGRYVKDAINMMFGGKEQTPGKDSGGPYYWEQEGAESLLNNLPGMEGKLGGNVDKLVFNFFGINSKLVDPVKAQKNYISGKNL
jgi:hypothetical protein